MHTVTADPLPELIAALKVAITAAEPHHLAGVLVEGIASTVAERIPPAAQGDVAVETVRLLRDRLRLRGVI